MSHFIFETQRLQCRQLIPEDPSSLVEVYGDAEAMRYVGDGSPLTEAEGKAWLKVTGNNYDKYGYGMFALLERATSRIVGFIGLVHPGGQREAEVKYAFLRTHWGQGLATEAVAALLEYGEHSHGLTHVIATVAPENLASQRVLTKVGMSKAELRDDEDGSQTQVFEWQP